MSIYFNHAANTISINDSTSANTAVSLSGLGNLIITSNVGINNTSPQYPLDITGSARLSSNMLNSAGRPIVAQTGSVIQTQYVSSSTRVSVDFGAGTWGEPSTAYRVTITPLSTSSYFMIHYMIPTNPGGSYATNTIFSARAFRSVSGTKTYALTSAGTQNSTRVGFSGITMRPNNGFDANDPMPIIFQSFDAPGTTSAVTYGFEFRRETGGTGVVSFGFSAGDNSGWGFDVNPLIIVQEIAQ